MDHVLIITGGFLAVLGVAVGVLTDLNMGEKRNTEYFNPERETVYSVFRPVTPTPAYLTDNPHYNTGIKGGKKKTKRKKY